MQYILVILLSFAPCCIFGGGRGGHDLMVVGFTTTCVISAYHLLSCEFEPSSWRGVLDTTLCDKVCK